MPVNTVIRSVASPAWVIEFVRRNWPIEATDAQLIRSLVNDVWRVRAADGDYALKIYRAGRWSTAEVAWEQDLARHLERAGITDAAVVPLHSGALAGVADAPEGPRPFAMTAWSSAAKPTPPFTDDLYRSFGAMIARFHESAASLHSEHPARAFDLPSVLDAPRERVISALSARGRYPDADLVERVGIRTAVTLRELDAAGLRHGIRHGDASLDNVHVSRAGLRLHDFDLSCPGWPAADLVGAMSTPFSDAFASGYRSRRELHELETLALPGLRAVELIRNLDFHLTDKVAIRGEESIEEGWVDAELNALRALGAAHGVEGSTSPTIWR